MKTLHGRDLGTGHALILLDIILAARVTENVGVTGPERARAHFGQ